MNFSTSRVLVCCKGCNPCRSSHAPPSKGWVKIVLAAVAKAWTLCVQHPVLNEPSAKRTEQININNPRSSHFSPKTSIICHATQSLFHRSHPLKVNWVVTGRKNGLSMAIKNALGVKKGNVCSLHACLFFHKGGSESGFLTLAADAYFLPAAAPHGELAARA